MVVLKTTQSIPRLHLFEKFYFFLLVLYTGANTPYTQVLLYPIRDHIFFMVIPILLTVILLFRKNRMSFKRFVLPASLFFGWIFLQLMKYGQVYPMTIFYIYNFVLAYIIVTIYKKSVFFLYEKYVTIISLIGLIVWVLYSFFPNEISQIMSSISLIPENNSLKSSIIIATLSNDSSILGMRNAGFSQEPGLYASLVCIAIYFNLIRNRFVIKKNWNFLILLLSLITTQSTTGYVTFLIILCFYAFNKKTATKYVFMIAIAILIPLAITLPFIGGKITKYWYNEDSKHNAAEMVSYNQNNNNIAVFVPQRIDAMVFDVINFINDPVLGYGVEDDNSYISKTVSKNIVLSEGNINLFGRFGLIIGICFVFCLVKTSKMMSLYYEYKGSLFLFFLWLAISASYDFNRHPLLLSIWLFFIFTNPLIYNKRNENNIRYKQRG